MIFFPNIALANILYINYGQVLYATTNCKTSYVLNEVPLSIYTLLETNIFGYTSQNHSYQLSLMIQLLKDRPLD